MREYKRYEEYKDSGVEWIGEIPENWEINKSKFISEVLLSNINKKTNEYEPKVLLCNYTDVYYNDFIDLNMNFMKASTSYDKKKKLRLEVGDVIITKDSESPDDIGIPAYVNETQDDLVCGYHLSMLKPYKNIILGKFLFRLLESNLLKNQFSMKSTGITRYSISLDTIKNIILLLPSKIEQQKISSFLDQKTAEIDEIIMKRETLIEQLEKYKKSVITEAVTKGKLGDKYINEDGELIDEIEMKDSGIEWLEEVPKYFPLVTMRRISRINQGLQIAISDRLENPDSDCFKYITVKYINSNKKEDLYYIKKPSPEVICDENDILYARTGATGQVITNTKGVFHNNFFKVNYDKRKIKKDFLYTFLSLDKFKDKILLLAGTTTIPDLNHDDFLDMEVLLPPIKIQDIIINYLSEKTEEIDNLIQKTKQSIEKYKKYKKSLIFEGVTGKIDLRDYELEGGEELAEHKNASTADREKISAFN